MQANVKRGFNRLFVVLTAVWVVYCLIVYPMQQQAAADAIYKDELRRCNEPEPGKRPDFNACLQYAQIKSGVINWSLNAFYARESWFLILVIVVVPLVAYGLCRGLAAVSAWVWRGFRL